MNYTPEQWEALCSEVDRQKGALLQRDRCLGSLISYHIPQKKTSYQVTSCRCGNESMIVARYDPSDDEEERKEFQSRGSGFARVCGRCDNVGQWPRFQGTMA